MPPIGIGAFTVRAYVYVTRESLGAFCRVNAELKRGYLANAVCVLISDSNSLVVVDNYLIWSIKTNEVVVPGCMGGVYYRVLKRRQTSAAARSSPSCNRVKIEQTARKLSHKTHNHGQENALFSTKLKKSLIGYISVNTFAAFATYVSEIQPKKNNCKFLRSA